MVMEISKELYGVEFSDAAKEAISWLFSTSGDPNDLIAVQAAVLHVRQKWGPEVEKEIVSKFHHIISKPWKKETKP